MAHGRHLGLVRGGRSRRTRPLLQPGNLFRVTWRARLSEHLGGFNVELIEAACRHASSTMRRRLPPLGSLTGLARLLRERDPHPALYAAALRLLRAFDDASVWPALLCAGSSNSWESSASASISPNVPRPASMPILSMSRRARAAPSRAMRAALLQGEAAQAAGLSARRDGRRRAKATIAAGFALTGHFLERDVLGRTASPCPQARERLIYGPLARSAIHPERQGGIQEPDHQRPRAAAVDRGKSRVMGRVNRSTQRRSAGRSSRCNSAQALGERYLVLCALDHHGARAARCARRAEARAPAAALRHAPAQARPAKRLQEVRRVVGDVIGQFHPHGDQSIYDALVRLAQDFAARYPLIDGQGNFGNIDGDNPAAMRYTEARLTAIAGRCSTASTRTPSTSAPTTTVDQEPVVLPAMFPNLLANGARASPSAWRPISRRTTPANSATRCCISSNSPTRPPTGWLSWSPAPIYRPAGSDRAA